MHPRVLDEVSLREEVRLVCAHRSTVLTTCHLLLISQVSLNVSDVGGRLAAIDADGAIAA